jgi:hypothetical protein
LSFSAFGKPAISSKKTLILGHFWSSSPVGNLKKYINGIAIEGFDTFSIYHLNDILA